MRIFFRPILKDAINVLKNKGLLIILGGLARAPIFQLHI